MTRFLLILLGAICVPLTVAISLPPTPDMGFWDASYLLLWLAFNGGLAGYAIDKIREDE